MDCTSEVINDVLERVRTILFYHVLRDGFLCIFFAQLLYFGWFLVLWFLLSCLFNFFFLNFRFLLPLGTFTTLILLLLRFRIRGGYFILVLLLISGGVNLHRLFFIKPTNDFLQGFRVLHEILTLYLDDLTSGGSGRNSCRLGTNFINIDFLATFI
jgi:hypothetical protein